MLVLFDNGTPRTLARYLIAYHTVTESRARGWEEFGNGELLTAAEAAGFEVLVTTDKDLSISKTLPTVESPSWYWGKHAGALSDRTSRRSSPP
jgi:hypothetical protein